MTSYLKAANSDDGDEGRSGTDPVVIAPRKQRVLKIYKMASDVGTG